MIDLIIVLIFVVYSVLTGLFYSKQASRGLEDYFLAGRSLKGWQAGLSMAATQFAADTPLLVTGLVATAGIFSLWRLWIYALAFLFMGFVLGSGWRRANVLTDAEFTELRYSGKAAAWLRSLKAIYLGTFVNCAILAMVLLAATRIAEPFLLWNAWLPEMIFEPAVQFVQSVDWVLTTRAETASVWVYSANNFISILAIVSFTVLYSMTGGLRSVVATDIVQFGIAMVGTAAYAWIVIQESGGMEQMIQQLYDAYGQEAASSLLNFGPSQWNEVTQVFMVVLAIQWFAQVNSDGTGYLAQRTMACKTDRDVKVAAVTFTVAQVLLRSLVWIPIALGLLVLYPVESMSGAGETFQALREETFARGIKDFMPVGFRGLMLTGMLAALASTVDTHLNWGASYWTHDLYKRFLMKSFFKREAKSGELVWIARLSSLTLLVIALIVTSKLSSIQAAWHVSLLFGSGLGVILILRWLWYRVNRWSEIAAVVISLILSPVLLQLKLDEGLRLLLMTGISTVGVVLVTLLTPPESEQTLVAFYKRVKPLGFWAPIAEASGEKGRQALLRLQRGSLATCFCAASIFALLVGFGKLITGNPYLAGIIPVGIGIILIPFWVRFGFKD